eukprot:jgi/Galph1/4390/GphlegSOOS_G3098.1
MKAKTTFSDEERIQNKSQWHLFFVSYYHSHCHKRCQHCIQPRINWWNQKRYGVDQYHKRQIVTIRAVSKEALDVVVIGSGIGGLVTATQLAKKGAQVAVFEKYLIPGGSAGYYESDGYIFDVGASMMFGLGKKGTTNTLTRALAAVGVELETIPDPVQINYHLPDNKNIRVHRDYQQFLEELTYYFPQGKTTRIENCWKVFNCLNAIELLSLEEPSYLWKVFREKPFSCFGLMKYLPLNAGDIARKYISDPILLSFIDLECYCWSVVRAEQTPMINAGMVFADRHYGGINYPKGGVGMIAKKLAKGLEDLGGKIHYGYPVTRILCHNTHTPQGLVTRGVQLKHEKQEISSKFVVSNATRWDTFHRLIEKENIPEIEYKWMERYEPSPSFLSLHIGVEAALLATSVIDCHHVILEDWKEMETANDAQGTIFISIPTVLDASLAPPGHHIFHIFTPSWFSEWKGLSIGAYKEKKARLAERIIQRVERVAFPGLASAIQHLEIGTPRTHRRFLSRMDGTYGPIPRKKLPGLLTMPLNRTSIGGLYCVGDSTFPGQGLNAVAFSGFACSHRMATDMQLNEHFPKWLDDWLTHWISYERLRLSTV